MAGRRDKNRKIRELRKVLLIIIERGNRTEWIYFSKFKQRNSNINIKLLNCKSARVVKLIEDAMDKAEAYGIDFDNGDAVWCVFDVDAKSNEELKKAKRLADRKGINIVLSNPSFELWFLLHTDYYSTRPFSSNEDLLKELKIKFPYYKKTDASMFETLLPEQKQAIDKARRLREYHLECGNSLCSRESNPCTQVFELVEYINEMT